MAEHAENKIKTYFILSNLPDTFQLTAKMNFQKYDFQRSRIFYRALKSGQLQKFRQNEIAWNIRIPSFE